MVVQGTVTWALHEYSPPSLCSTGENAREREETVPVVITVPTLTRSLLSTCVPFGWYHWTCGAMFIPCMPCVVQIIV